MVNGTTEMRVKVEGGYIVATASCDPDYPGIDVEFEPDECGDNGEKLSNPRILLEKPAGEKIRAILWTDSQTEDYTHEIYFE